MLVKKEWSFNEESDDPNLKLVVNGLSGITAAMMQELYKKTSEQIEEMLRRWHLSETDYKWRQANMCVEVQEPFLSETNAVVTQTRYYCREYLMMIEIEEFGQSEAGKVVVHQQWNHVAPPANPDWWKEETDAGTSD